jgi:hypothetical protein
MFVAAISMNNSEFRAEILLFVPNFDVNCVSDFKDEQTDLAMLVDLECLGWK